MNASFRKKQGINHRAGSIALILSALMMTLSGQIDAAESYQNLSLSNAIEVALKNNLEKQISFQSAAIAESQYQQALSARWPTLTFQAGFQHRDKSPTFIFPATNMSIGPLPPILPVPIPVSVPEQNVKIMSQNTTTSSLQLLFPL
jgi:outer membrane protein TolC